MTPTEIAREVQADCKRDARKWDGKPMTGQNVATMHGETLAMISVLAHLVEVILEGPDCLLCREGVVHSGPHYYGEGGSDGGN